MSDAIDGAIDMLWGLDRKYDPPPLGKTPRLVLSDFERMAGLEALAKGPRAAAEFARSLEPTDDAGRRAAKYFLTKIDDETAPTFAALCRAIRDRNRRAIRKLMRG